MNGTIFSIIFTVLILLVIGLIIKHNTYLKQVEYFNNRILLLESHINKYDLTQLYKLNNLKYNDVISIKCKEERLFFDVFEATKSGLILRKQCKRYYNYYDSYNGCANLFFTFDELKKKEIVIESISQRY